MQVTSYEYLLFDATTQSYAAYAQSSGGWHWVKCREHACRWDDSDLVAQINIGVMHNYHNRLIENDVRIIEVVTIITNSTPLELK
jgi:hypothetical protein